MGNILLTMNEDTRASTSGHFAVTYKVDEHDCLAYAGALAALGNDVFYVNWNDFGAGGFERMFHHNDRRFVPPLPLEAIDLAWIYQMEGFYADVPRFFRMVGAFEDACATVMNDPRTIRHNLGKTYLWALERCGVRVIPTYRIDASIASRLDAGERFVLKPLRGERGRGVSLARKPEDLAAIASREGDYIAQEYMPRVRNGERSLVFLGYDFQHAVIKHPSPQKPDEFRCNESLGGTVHVYDPTADELAYARDVLAAYESLGCPVHYSRIDFVESDGGPALMEAELLNPAAFANYSGKGAQFGRSVAAYVDALMTEAAERRPQLQHAQ
jgi:glutathione synthase/RimK-type ligase-like ATP-grasp enzyme